MKITTSLILSIACTLFAAPLSHANNAYKWTDEKGQVHYGERAPSNVKKEVIKTQRRTDATKETGAAAPKPTEQIKTESAAPSLPKDSDLCANARKNIEVLKTSDKIRVKDDNGESRYLTAEEVQQKIELAKKIAQHNCEE